MPTTISRFWTILAVALIVACAVFAACLTYYESRPPRTQAELLNRMTQLASRGRYEKAAQLAQNWMNASRNDNSQDGFLYEQIALMYIEEAYKNPKKKLDSIQAAETSLEKALAVSDNSDSASNAILFDQIGRGYEALGDLTDGSKCHYYREALQLYIRQLPLIKGDSYTAYGATIPLEPVRAEIRKHLNDVNAKLSQLNCQ